MRREAIATSHRRQPLLAPKAKQEKKRSGWDRIKVPLLFSLTIGLMPFFPEPHLVMAARHLSEGTMSTLDWVELLGHGAPWLVLLWRLGSVAVDKRRR